MFRLLRFLFSGVVFLIVLWFVVSVPVGKHTLWGHLMRIAKTEEVQDLADGARDTAKDVVRRVHTEVEEGAKDRPAREAPQRKSDK